MPFHRFLQQRWLRRGALLWLALSLFGGVWLALGERQRLREAFETDARIIHRLLSQRGVQHEAILAMLALLQPAEEAGGVGAEQRLPSMYPQILRVERRQAAGQWPEALAGIFAEAEEQSRRNGHAAVAGVDFAAGRYWLVLAAQPVSYAAHIDLRAMIPQAEWPLPAQGGPVGLELRFGGQAFAVETGRPAGQGPLHTRFEFRKTIAAASQPFEVFAWREFGWQALPWAAMVAWSLALAALFAFLAWLLAQRARRRRAEELLRLGQIARLNALGEMAAGLAHELNQPLTAVSANAQAARRLLDDDPADLAAARAAMAHAVAQSKRAAEVLARLRRAIERPGLSERSVAVGFSEAARNVLYLIEPECRRRGVVPTLAGEASLRVMADPVALEQIIHNLLMNALQAMESVSEAERRLALRIAREKDFASLQVADSGPGIPPENLPRLFEPFFTTREGGLGLGLSLCETLATAMGGRLRAENGAAAGPGRGAVFTLQLPLAEPS